MSIVITIVKFPESITPSRPTFTFTEQGGSIGRGDDNNWVLEDPERFVSTRHCQISHENGQYLLVDLSTNGTFYNGASEPIGSGNKIPLNDGDRFLLGDYEFQVSSWSPEADLNNGPFGQPVEQGGPFADAGSLPGFDADPFASSAGPFHDPFDAAPSGHVSSEEPLFGIHSEETDPLAALDKAAQIGDLAPQPNDPFATDSFSDSATGMNQAVSWPEASPDTGMIPENWEDDWLDESPQDQSAGFGQANVAPPPQSPSPAVRPAPTARPTPTRPPSPPPAAAAPVVAGESLDSLRRELQEEKEKIQAELALLKQQSMPAAAPAPVPPVPAPEPAAPATPKTAGATDKILIEAMGLSGRDLSEEKIAEISMVVGELVRETVMGMMQVLSSRSSIKNEFRMNVTTIQPVENNPLKFSANIDDAIENMFIKQGNAYKKPVEAVREGFDGIAEHQVAILAGIRSAFKGVIERFDPVTLEKRFQKYHRGSLIPGSQKARNWDLFGEYYNELVDDMDNSFQHLFGYEFVQAYEEQLHKLAIARKTKNI